MNGRLDTRLNGQQYSIGDLNYQQMTGLPGIGFHRWLINLSLKLDPKAGPDKNYPVRIQDIRGELVTLNGDNLIARFALQDHSRSFNQNAHHDHFSLECEISDRRIHAIDEMRRGTDLTLKLKIRAFAIHTGTYQSQPAEGELFGIRLTQSDWTRLLREMQYRRVILLEVEQPEETKDPHGAKLFSQLNQAHDALSRGDSTEVVRECRVVLESLKKYFTSSEENKGKQLSKQGRYRELNQALLNVSHLATHGDDLAQATTWDSQDARTILAMTTSMVQMSSWLNKKQPLVQD